MNRNTFNILGAIAALAAAPRRSVPYGDEPVRQRPRISAMFAGSKKKTRAARRKATGR